MTIPPTSYHVRIVTHHPVLLLQRRFLPFLKPHQLPARRRAIDTDDRYLVSVDQVMTRVAQDRQVTIVVRAPRIATWDDVVDVQGGRSVVITNLTTIFGQSTLAVGSPLPKHTKNILRAENKENISCLFSTRRSYYRSPTRP